MNTNEFELIENLEKKYLMKYFHFLKFTEDEILKGLATKNDIRDDWIEKWSNGDKKVSDFNTGAERVIYALINSKGIGIPNSCPVGSDLMFEVDDAYIHIDLKTVQTSNIGDFANSIFVGNNQISYNGNFTVNGEKRVYDFANLPHFYMKHGKEKKYCLTYFLSILHDSETLETLCIHISCFPNGYLGPIYKDSVFKAGKIPSQARFNFLDCKDFKLAKGRRIFIVYLNEKLEKCESKLKSIIDLQKTQNF